ncbi:CPBP family intramembrane glutamic endopeptidase [Convivina praedatoris]|uniref:CPBP family intramembrane glutamic endopeptidase n=1 Tax=Convivina praedatoris TaxID=2880963 RepID=UPI00200BA7BD|nr:CPBP family intramembrane glutamic endopeptidase [Convivina sp. LMG 32447]CAH1854604.1 hypothetical protein R078138_00913 [Convivina sp. LMG 32447]
MTLIKSHNYLIPKLFLVYSIYLIWMLVPIPFSRGSLLAPTLTTLLLLGLNHFVTKQKINWSWKLSRKSFIAVSILTAILILLTIPRQQPSFLIYLQSLDAGINEELLDRGIVLATLLILFKNSSNPKAQLLWPIILSSLIFGLSHFMNLSWQDPLSTLFQVTTVSGTGFLLACIYLRTHNILLAMYCHFFIDAYLGLISKFDSLDSGNSIVTIEMIPLESLSTLIHIIIEVGIGLFLIRKQLKSRG